MGNLWVPIAVQNYSMILFFLVRNHVMSFHNILYILSSPSPSPSPSPFPNKPPSKIKVPQKQALRRVLRSYSSKVLLFVLLYSKIHKDKSSCLITCILDWQDKFVSPKTHQPFLYLFYHFTFPLWVLSNDLSHILISRESTLR